MHRILVIYAIFILNVLFVSADTTTRATHTPSQMSGTSDTSPTKPTSNGPATSQAQKSTGATTLSTTTSQAQKSTGATTLSTTMSHNSTTTTSKPFSIPGLSNCKRAEALGMSEECSMMLETFEKNPKLQKMNEKIERDSKNCTLEQTAPCYQDGYHRQRTCKVNCTSDSNINALKLVCPGFVMGMTQHRGFQGTHFEQHKYLCLPDECSNSDLLAIRFCLQLATCAVPKTPSAPPSAGENSFALDKFLPPGLLGNQSGGMNSPSSTDGADLMMAPCYVTFSEQNGLVLLGKLMLMEICMGLIISASAIVIWQLCKVKPAKLRSVHAQKGDSEGFPMWGRLLMKISHRNMDENPLVDGDGAMSMATLLPDNQSSETDADSTIVTIAPSEEKTDRPERSPEEGTDRPERSPEEKTGPPERPPLTTHDSAFSITRSKTPKLNAHVTKAMRILGSCSERVRSDNPLMEANEPLNLILDCITYQKEHSVVLRGISAFVQARSTVCVIGAPDSRATTLLQVIARRHGGGKLSGQLLLNNQALGQVEYRRLVGYIPKEEIHIPTLTVRETLMFSLNMQVH